MPLPKDYNARKALPLYDFLTNYFPDAFIEVCKVAVAGNVQHGLGPPLRWVRGVSMDQLNTAMRHIMDHGMGNMFDEEPPEVLAAINAADSEYQDSTMHLAKAAWRLLAQIQLLCEERDAARGQGAQDSVELFPEAPDSVADNVARRNGADEDYMQKLRDALPALVPGRLELVCGCKGYCKGGHELPAVPLVPTGTGPRDPAGKPYAPALRSAMDPRSFDPAD